MPIDEAHDLREIADKWGVPYPMVIQMVLKSGVTALKHAKGVSIPLVFCVAGDVKQNGNARANA